MFLPGAGKKTGLQGCSSVFYYCFGKEDFVKKDLKEFWNTITIYNTTQVKACCAGTHPAETEMNVRMYLRYRAADGKDKGELCWTKKISGK